MDCTNSLLIPELSPHVGRQMSPWWFFMFQLSCIITEGLNIWLKAVHAGVGVVFDSF